MRIFFNNNIFKESIIFLQVFSKYALSKIRNIFPIHKKQAMIRIFASAFNYGNVFLKRNMDEDKKENFIMEIVKKKLCRNSIFRVEVYLPSIFLTCTVESGKLCSSLFLLLANLCFQVVRGRGKKSPPTSFPSVTSRKVGTRPQNF